MAHRDNGRRHCERSEAIQGNQPERYSMITLSGT